MSRDTTTSAIPSFMASAAVTRRPARTSGNAASRPVRTRSRSRLPQLGTSPTSISEKPSTEVGRSTTMSCRQASASSKPGPRHAPSTHATVGIGSFRNRPTSAWPRSAQRSRSSVRAGRRVRALAEAVVAQRTDHEPAKSPLALDARRGPRPDRRASRDRSERRFRAGRIAARPCLRLRGPRENETGRMPCVLAPSPRFGGEGRGEGAVPCGDANSCEVQPKEKAMNN